MAKSINSSFALRTNLSSLRRWTEVGFLSVLLPLLHSLLQSARKMRHAFGPRRETLRLLLPVWWEKMNSLTGWVRISSFRYSLSHSILRLLIQDTKRRGWEEIDDLWSWRAWAEDAHNRPQWEYGWSSMAWGIFFLPFRSLPSPLCSLCWK